MKLSIFTTGKNPVSRGDLFDEPLSCYNELADEVVYVDGSGDLPNGQHGDLCYVWPKEFSWELIGQQFQRGYEACTGDVVIHADLDFIFHEKHSKSIRQAAQRMLDEHQPAVSFFKYQFILPDRYNLKSRLVIMVNKKDFGDRIKFDGGGESDLCQPSLDGEYIKPADVPEAQIPFYNYEKILKTRQQIADDQGRMERAYFRHFGKTQYGSDGTDEGAYNNWIEAQKGKFNKPQKFIKLTDHPKYMQDTIKNLTVDQWGYSGHGLLEENKYVQSM